MTAACSNCRNGTGWVGFIHIVPFLPEPDLDHPEAITPTGRVYLDPYSDEYFDKLAAALELDSPMYANIDSEVIVKFKEILRKYLEAFHLPGTPLGTIKGFYHNIDTRDSPPVYQLPYKKNPAELNAIKNELQRMLSLNILKPSHSPNGSRVFLSANHWKKVNPSHPGLLWTTGVWMLLPLGMVIPFQVYPMYLMPLVGGGYLASLTLPAVTGRCKSTSEMFITQPLQHI